MVNFTILIDYCLAQLSRTQEKSIRTISEDRKMFSPQRLQRRSNGIISLNIFYGKYVHNKAQARKAFPLPHPKRNTAAWPGRRRFAILAPSEAAPPEPKK
jgi:hypothetical protein